MASPAALTASAVDLLAADAVVVGTPANIGYLSGALKHFFDPVDYPTLTEEAGLPYGMYVHGGDDTTDSGAGRRADREGAVVGAGLAAGHGDRFVKWRTTSTPAASSARRWPPTCSPDGLTERRPSAAGTSAHVVIQVPRRLSVSDHRPPASATTMCAAVTA